MNQPTNEENLEELIEEYVRQIRAGNELTAEEYAATHPDCKDELLEVLPAALSMEHMRLDIQDSARPLAEMPKRLGDYRIVRVIGQGGMSVVYEAVQESLDRIVALKTLTGSLSMTPSFRSRLQQEARTIAKLEHPNIVNVYGAGEDADALFFVMERINGVGLDRVIENDDLDAEAESVCKEVFPKGRTDPRAVARIVLQAAEALDYAHARGVIHRDIKPSNLLLDGDGVLHVSDFGLATTLQEGVNSQAQTQSNAGTMRYMAPERLHGITTVASDQYSLGLTMYEMLTGKVVFKEPGLAPLMRNILEDPPPPPSKFIPDLPRDLDTIVSKAIAFEPEQRYQHVEDLAEDIRLFLANEPILARKISPLKRMLLWCKRHPALASMGLISCALSLALVVSVGIGYVKVSNAYEQESIQRKVAENNARIAHSVLEELFDNFYQQPGMSQGSGFTEEQDGLPLYTVLPVSEEIARMLEKMLPFYESLSSQSGVDISMQRDAAHASITLGRIFDRLGKHAKAIESFERGLGQLEQLAIENPDGNYSTLIAYSLNNIGLAWRNMNNEANALASFAKVVEMDSIAPSQDRLYETVRALYYFNLPQKAIPGGGRDSQGEKQKRNRLDMREAGNILEQLLTDSPNNPAFRLMLARCMLISPQLQNQIKLEGHSLSAQKILEELVHEYPDRPEFRLELVEALARINPRTAETAIADSIKQLNQSIVMADELAMAYPHEPTYRLAAIRVRYKQAGLLRRSNSFDQALQEIEKAIMDHKEITGNHIFSPTILSWDILLSCMKADLLLKMNQSDKAQAIIEKVEQQIEKPEYPESLQDELRQRIERISSKIR